MSAAIDHIKNELQVLDSLMLESEEHFRERIALVHPSQQESASNLIHYLTLRSHDIRSVQDKLHKYGLSSLASSESHIRSQLLAILSRLNVPITKDAGVTYKSSRKILRSRSEQLFGQAEKWKVPSIMVTLDSVHANGYVAVKSLLQSGMNIARINCSHDDKDMWTRMVEHVRKASIITGSPCKIYMDLPGPKIRTHIPAKKKKKARIKVKEGETIYLAEKMNADRKNGIIGCTLPGITGQLQKGDRVLIDDGMIEARITDIFTDKVQLEVLRISSKKAVIKSEKGINLPDTKLRIPPLTSSDWEILPFIQEHADMIGFSFVHQAKDLLALQDAMTIKKLPIIIKVETLEAVKNLPDLLLQGMREPLFGVMIARGDLAVEIGFERLSEIQEEILWICDAGHVPAVWATQVLENLNKSGIATRSEVTDAAHAIMAECVLINKGSHTIEVIEALRDILYRSGAHHAKKRYTFRPLSIASSFINSVKASDDN